MRPPRFDFPSVFWSARRVIRGLGTETQKVIDFRVGLAKEILDTHKDRDIYGTSGRTLYEAVVSELADSAERVIADKNMPAICEALRKLNKPISTNVAITDERWFLRAFQETFRDYPSVTPGDARDMRIRAVNLLVVHQNLVGRYSAEPFLAYIVACVIREKTLGMTDVGRTSNCWNCHLTVMEVFNPPCSKCRWMVCVCGACSHLANESHTKALMDCDQPDTDWFRKICEPTADSSEAAI